MKRRRGEEEKETNSQYDKPSTIRLKLRYIAQSREKFLDKTSAA